jgi:hypothetical protein
VLSPQLRAASIARFCSLDRPAAATAANIATQAAGDHVKRFARTSDHISRAGGVAESQFDIKQICIRVCRERVLDHHSDLADIARAIGEQEGVTAGQR